jgi:hypothetical protein
MREYILPLAPYVTSDLRVFTPNQVNLNCPYRGNFSHMDMLQIWQLRPTIRHMTQYCVPPSATKHKSSLTCGYALSPASAATKHPLTTYSTLFPKDWLKFHFGNWSALPVISGSSGIRGAHHLPSCTACVLLNRFYPTQPTVVYTEGSFLHRWQALLSYVLAWYFPNVFLILIAFSLLNSVPCTKAFCLSGASLGSIFSFVQPT